MNIYITDGSESAFYSAAFHACTDTDCIVTSAKHIQLTLDARILPTEYDAEKCARVKNKLSQYDSGACNDISLILRRGAATREMTALNYLRRIVQLKCPVRDRLSDPAVIEAMDERGKVTLEAHRFKGFLRFMEGKGGIFYAPFSPDNDILELILPHFMRRLSSQSFIIHDTLRHKAALWNGKDCAIAATDENVSVQFSPDEENFQALWREYYRSVNISQRPHEKQMKGYMPVRYWKFMPEKNPHLR